MSEKYRELMDRVCVTDDMRSRILEQVSVQTAVYGRRTRWKSWMAAAACLCLILGGGVMVHQSRNPAVPEVQTPPEQPTLTAPGLPAFEELDSREALEERAGFPVEKLPDLPFEAEEVVYILRSPETAEVAARNQTDKATYRKSTADGDPSGDYNDYPVSQTAAVDGTDVTMKGGQDGYHLALWSRDGFSCSFHLSTPVPENEFADLIQNILNQ